MIKSERRKSFEFAFLVTPDDLRSFDKIFDRLEGEKLYSIRCSDGSIITFNDINDVIDFSNSESRKIEQLDCTGGSYAETFASIDFDNRKIIGPKINFSVKGEDETVVVISSQIEEQLIRTRQWYSRLATLDMLSLFCVVLIGLLFIVSGHDLYLWVTDELSNKKSSDSNDLPDTAGTFIWLALLVSIFLLSKILNIGRELVFPRGEFTVGDGAKRHDSAIFWRRIFGGGFLLSIAVSLMSSGISKQIFG